jgi:hypothetical protein
MARSQLRPRMYSTIHGRDPGILRGTSRWITVPVSMIDDQYLTNSVNRRLLTLFSRVLELDDDYLWNNVQSHVDGSETGDGYSRPAIFRPV